MYLGPKRRVRRRLGHFVVIAAFPNLPVPLLHKTQPIYNKKIS
jgi:hypothetical protein